MNFKRGIFFGLIAIIASIQGFSEMNGIDTVAVFWFYLFLLFLGMIQCRVSIHYEKLYHSQILLLCFCLEAIYYVIAIAGILISDTGLGVKIFGSIVGIIFESFIIASIHSIAVKIFSKIK